MNKLWYVQTVEYDPILRGKKVRSHWRTQRKLECISLRKRSQPEKAAYWMIQTMWQSIETLIRKERQSVVARGWGLRKWRSRIQNIFRARSVWDYYWRSVALFIYSIP